MTTQLIDDYNPHWVGDTGRPLMVQFLDFHDNPLPLTDVVAADITAVMQPHNGGLGRLLQGSWTIDDAAQAIASLHWHATDVAQAGIFDFQIEVPYSGKPQHFEIKEITFLQPLVAG